MNLQVAGRRLRTAIRYGREYGLLSLLRLVRSKVQRPSGLLGKIEVIDFYDFVRRPPVGRPIVPGDVPANTVNWFMPPFSRGSGGHLNIFRFIHHLEKQGFECRVIIVGEPQPVSAGKAARQIAEWFFPLKASVYLGGEQAPSAHISVATAWQTAYTVRGFLATVHRCYFVQDFEPWFYAAGSEYAFAEETYRFGFIGVTAGNWLAEKIAGEYGMKTHAVGFSYDRDRYCPEPRKEHAIRKVFFYARPPTIRRGFELGIMVLAEVTRRLPEVEVICAGWDVSAYAIPFTCSNAGVVNLSDLPDLYRQCDVALVLSFSNLSLLPLEIMACGVPVVSNRAPCTEWLLNDDNAQLAPPTVEGLADAVCAVLENPDEAARLRDAGLRTATATDWGREAARMGEIFRGLDDAAMRDGSV